MPAKNVFKKLKGVIHVVWLSGLMLVFINIKPIYAVGAVPENCLNPTNANPANDLVCAPIVDGNPNNICDGTCISYCPTYRSNWAKLEITSDIKNISIRVPARAGFRGNGVRVILKDSSRNVILDQHLLGSGQYVTATDPQGRIFHKGDVVYLKIIDYDAEAGSNATTGMLGFRTPSPNSTFSCGEDNIACSGCTSCPPPAARCSVNICTTNVGLTDFSYLLDGLDNKTIINKMCFADTPVGNADFDFNDMGAVLFGDPVQEPTPTPTVTPECLDLTATANTGKDGKNRLYEFTCKVNAYRCELKIDELETKSATPQEGGICSFSYYFDKSGDYPVTCYAVGNDNTKSTSEACQTKVHIPEDSAGDYLFPAIFSITAALLLAKPLYGVYRRII